LVNLYEPVVETAFNKYWEDSTSCRWKIALSEVVKWVDCSVSFPVQPKLRSQVDLARPGEHAIHIYNPKHHFKYSGGLSGLNSKCAAKGRVGATPLSRIASGGGVVSHGGYHPRGGNLGGSANSTQRRGRGCRGPWGYCLYSCSAH